MCHHAAHDELLNAETAQAVVKLCAEEAVRAVFYYNSIGWQRLYPVRYLTAVCPLDKKVVIQLIDVLDVNNMTAKFAALLYQVSDVAFSLTGVMKLAGTSFEVVVLYVDYK